MMSSAAAHTQQTLICVHAVPTKLLAIFGAPDSLAADHGKKRTW